MTTTSRRTTVPIDTPRPARKRRTVHVVDNGELARIIGRRIRAARARAGLTQRELADDRFTGAYISALENGLAKPSMSALRYVAERLAVPMDRFLAEVDNPPAPPAMARPPRRSPRKLERAGTCECGDKLPAYQRHTDVIDCIRSIRELVGEVAAGLRFLAKVRESHEQSLVGIETCSRGSLLSESGRSSEP